MNPKTVVIGLMALITFLNGALLPFVHLRRAPILAVFLVLVLLDAFLFFLWYRLDAEQRSYRRTYLLNVCVAAFGLVGLPYYLFRSRGFAGGFAATVLFILSIPGSLFVSLLGQLLIFIILRSWHSA